MRKCPHCRGNLMAEPLYGPERPMWPPLQQETVLLCMLCGRSTEPMPVVPLKRRVKV